VLYRHFSDNRADQTKIMKILAIESSGLVASAALVQDDILVAEYTTDHKKTHSITLMPMIEEIMRMTETDTSELDAIAVSAGPGSFTGLRIGSATAKGMGLVAGIPLINVPSLEGLAYNLWGSKDLVCPIMDARRGQVYCGIYRFTDDANGLRYLESVREQDACDMRELIEYINGRGERVIFLGDGVPVFCDMIKSECAVDFSFAPAHLNRQRASSVAALGRVYFEKGLTVTAAEHAPVYMRKSQAEREREERLGGSV